LIKYNSLNMENVPLLKIGRHFRLGPRYKLIVGKDEKENNQLLSLAKSGDFIYSPDEEIKGPIALGRGEPDAGQIDESCKIVARYCDENENKIAVSIKRLGSDFKKDISCAAFNDKQAAALRI